MHDHLVHDSRAVSDATALISQYGDHAVVEAANRAENSRQLGNVVHFCHWRQTERAIAMLCGEEVIGSIH